MTGVLAQIVALAAYGNDFLKNNDQQEDFYPGNSTFQFCNQVDFRAFKKKFFSGKTDEVIVATDPNQWFRMLKKEGCNSLRIYHGNGSGPSNAKEHQMAGFVGGGGAWYIEAGYKGYSRYWANKWKATKQNDPNRKVWTVNYGLTSDKQQTNEVRIDRPKMKADLKQTLTDVTDFAFKQKMDGWGKWFGNALAVLDSQNPGENYYHKDLIPAGSYSLEARQLLFAAGSAWAFGGMGSWNDMSFDDKAINTRYNELSERLYSNINEAIISAVNGW